MNHKLIGLILLLAGLVLLIAALSEWLGRRSSARTQAICTGRVVGIRRCRMERADGGTQTVHDATVSYTVEGVSYLSVIRILPGEVIHLPGSEIRLSYEPPHPERVTPAYAAPQGQRATRPLFIACSALLTAGLALFFAL